jgi:glutamine synthetase
MTVVDTQDVRSGRGSFVERHGLHSEKQREAAEELAARVRERGLKTIRIAWADQHGVPRCKFVSREDFIRSLNHGMDFSGATVHMDMANHVFTPLFAEGGGFGIPELTGFQDFILVPDPTTFHELPWAPGTGWVLSDMYFSNGRPVPFSTRAIMRRQLDEARALGYDYMAGLEVEFYILKRESKEIPLLQTGWPPPPPAVSVVAQGYQYLSETRLAEMSSILEILRQNLEQLGLPLRTMEDEWGPGQTEITFDPLPGLEPADSVVLFRSAVKQICYDHGYHATFMTRPAFPNFFSSGWHLHQSLLDVDSGVNAFMGSGDAVLSRTGLSYVAGLLEHAIPMTVFACPTITGYKRFKPYSFAPDRVTWAVENRGALVRIQGTPDDPSTHVENRMGESCANPYLYMAANIAAGLDGIKRGLQPPPPVNVDPYAADAPMLPTALWQAMEALDRDPFFREAFGDPVVDYVLAMKKSEVDRFLSEVTDWEMREYFEFF